jgi:hypothetical protein
VRVDDVGEVMRGSLARQVVDAYAAGASIRQIANEVDRSYNWVHGRLTEAGVQMRPRGGDRSGRGRLSVQQRDAMAAVGALSRMRAPVPDAGQRVGGQCRHVGAGLQRQT